MKTILQHTQGLVHSLLWVMFQSCGSKAKLEVDKTLAYVLAPHEDSALVKLKALLQPFGLTRIYTDAWRGYSRLLDSHRHVIDKANTQNPHSALPTVTLGLSRPQQSK